MFPGTEVHNSFGGYTQDMGRFVTQKMCNDHMLTTAAGSCVCLISPNARERKTPPLKALAMLIALLDSTKLRIFMGTSQQTTLSVVRHTWSRIFITFRLIFSPPLAAAASHKKNTGQGQGSSVVTQKIGVPCMLLLLEIAAVSSTGAQHKTEARFCVC